MKERPILFSAPMVRAILDGTKTQTRRIVKADDAEWLTRAHWNRGSTDEDVAIPADEAIEAFERRSPFGVLGDRLWVRESCWLLGYVGETEQEWQFGRLEGGDPVDVIVGPDGDLVDGDPPRVWYAADGDLPGVDDWIWLRRNSIHMPRWASRITLEIESVRVERLQDINDADAKAEGFPLPNPQKTKRIVTWPDGRMETSIVDAHFFDARGNFCAVWEALNGKRAPWASNPWVWVVQFRKVGT